MNFELDYCGPFTVDNGFRYNEKDLIVYLKGRVICRLEEIDSAMILQQYYPYKYSRFELDMKDKLIDNINRAVRNAANKEIVKILDSLN